MDTVISENPNEKYAVLFENMATAIRQSTGRWPFAGAVLIVEPVSGAVITYAHYGSVTEGNFWGSLGNEIAAKVREIEQKNAMQRPYLR